MGKASLKKPTQNQIDAVIDECDEHDRDGTSKFPGMNYEQGVKAAIEWLSGHAANPMDD